MKRFGDRDIRSGEMEEEGLPARMFETGFEPERDNRINNYFTLRLLETIKPAIEKEHMEQLVAPQFGRLMHMGHHTFSVRFVHYLLCRQLVTKKQYELWWIYAGKPICYAIDDFALVTGLNCAQFGESAVRLRQRSKGKGKAKVRMAVGKMWHELFGKAAKVTTEWVLDKLLQGKKYKDSVTRFRLALIFLAEGILCTSCNKTLIRPEVVEMVADIEGFLKYPWGRESFLMTVESAKKRTVFQFAQDTTAIQGFAHAMVLVTVCCCPEIIANPRFRDTVADPSLPVEEVVQSVVERSLIVNVMKAKNIDKKGQAHVRSVLNESLAADGEFTGFIEEEDDEEVSHMVSLISDGFPFEHNSWRGGVKADDVVDEEQNHDVHADGCDNDDTDVEVEYPETKSKPCNINEDGKEKGNKCGTPPRQYKEKDNCHMEPDLHGVIRLAANAFEERTLAMFEGYAVSLKDHFDERLYELRKELFEKEIQGLRKTYNSPTMDEERTKEHTFHSKDGKTKATLFGGKADPMAITNEVSNENHQHFTDLIYGPTKDPRQSYGGSCAFFQTRDNPEKEMAAAVEGNEANFDVSGRVKDKDGVDIVNFNEPCFSMPSFSIGLTQMAAAESESCLGTTREEATIPTDIDAPSFKIGLTQLETESLSDGNANVLVASVDISKTSVHEGGIDPSIGLVPIVGADDVDSDPGDYIPIARRLIKRSRKKAIKLGPPGEASTKPLVKPSVGKPQPATEKSKGVKRKSQLTGGSPKRSNHLRPLIGGFNPFGLPKVNRSRCFLKDMQRARLYKVCNGCEIENTGFREIFESRKLLNERGADVLVKFIQKRRDKIRNIRYDFIPASFLSELKRQYNRFCAARTKRSSFSHPSHDFS